ncbi:MAG: hypothetical protein K2W82_00200 [Candidatus Obscuribacterales bacterium]|nr:hypothetical protein [Candidatus Obscuribacterales bacterium]
MVRISLNEYQKHLVGFIRRREAELSRGDISKLESLDRTSDDMLLRKWSWLSTIVCAAFSFLLMPFIISLIQRLIPNILYQMLWLITKTSMAVSLVVFAAAVYFTVLRTPD